VLPGHHDHAHAHEPGFIGKYIFSLDHKQIGRQFLFSSLFFFIIGGAFALMLRWHLAYPQGDIPLGASLPSSMVAKAPAHPSVWKPGHPVKFYADYEGYPAGKEAVFKEFTKVEHPTPYRLEPITALVTVDGQDVEVPVSELVSSKDHWAVRDEFYSTLFTMHGTVMIFLVIIPLLVGAFGNFCVPLQIGARDMAFPILNMVSFWMVPPAAAVLMFGTFLVAADGTAAGPGSGWTSYPTLSVLFRSNGQSCWLIAIIILGTSSILGAVNYVTTIVKMRAPGMGLFRMPLTVWSIFITSILVLFATPVLASAALMQLMDHLGATSFFIPRNTTLTGQAVPQSGGGQPLLWQHLFWFYSHPAVYIMILPAMGIVSDVLSTFARKPIFGYRPMIYAIAAIAGLGFIVWGHHMFVSGMNPALGASFALATIMIALPSAIKTFNWLGTLWGGNIQFTTAMLNAIAFVAMFVIGGLSGIFMASTPVDIFIHDTYFIVAHIHYVLFGGSVFGAFAGIYYWFPKMFGRMMSEKLGKVHFVLTFITFNMTFFAMHILGMGGMPRRYANFDKFMYLDHLRPMNEIVTIGAFLLGAAQIFFAINFVWSIFKGPKAPRNPWHANTLEWTAPSPPGHGNFETTPQVYRGPYEYGSPLTEEDYLPQTRKITVET
jgi:cytochrome c oxidase subunit 1